MRIETNNQTVELNYQSREQLKDCLDRIYEPWMMPCDRKTIIFCNWNEYQPFLKTISTEIKEQAEYLENALKSLWDAVKVGEEPNLTEKLSEIQPVHYTEIYLPDMGFINICLIHQ